MRTLSRASRVANTRTKSRTAAPVGEVTTATERGTAGSARARSNTPSAANLRLRSSSIARMLPCPVAWIVRAASW